MDVGSSQHFLVEMQSKHRFEAEKWWCACGQTMYPFTAYTPERQLTKRHNQGTPSKDGSFCSVQPWQESSDLTATSAKGQLNSPSFSQEETKLER